MGIFRCSKCGWEYVSNIEKVACFVCVGLMTKIGQFNYVVNNRVADLVEKKKTC